MRLISSCYLLSILTFLNFLSACSSSQELQGDNNTATENNPYESFDLLSIKIAANQASIEEKVSYVDFALNFKKVQFAKDVINQLLESDPSNPNFRLLYAKLLFDTFRWNDALFEANQVLETHPNHEGVQFFLCELLIRHPDLLNRIKGKHRLFELAESSDSEIGFRALRELAFSLGNLVGASEKEVLLNRIMLSKHANLEESFKAFSILHADQKIDISIPKIIEKYRDIPALLWPWLAEKNYYEIIDQLAKSRLETGRNIHLDLLIELIMTQEAVPLEARVSKAKAIINKNFINDKPSSLITARFIVFLFNKNSGKFENSINELFNDFHKLNKYDLIEVSQKLCKMCFEINRFDLIEKMCSLTIDKCGEHTSLLIWELYLVSTLKNKGAIYSIPIIDEMERLFPGEFSVINNSLYIKLLLGVNPEACLKKIIEIISTSAFFPELRTTLALGYLMNGKITESEKVIGTNYNDLYLKDSDKVICAIILHQCQRLVEAKKILGSIQFNNLIDAELSLLKSFGVEI